MPPRGAISPPRGMRTSLISEQMWGACRLYSSKAVSKFLANKILGRARMRMSLWKSLSPSAMSEPA